MTVLNTETGLTLELGVVELEEFSKLVEALEEDQEFRNAFITNPRWAIQEKGFNIPQELIPEVIETLDLSEFPSPDIMRIREVEITPSYKPD